MKKCRNSERFRKEVQRCGSTRGAMGPVAWREIQKHRMQKYRGAQMQKCRNAEMQKYRNIEMQKYRNIEIQKYNKFTEGGV